MESPSTGSGLDTGFWGWAIVALTLAYIAGLIITGHSNGMEFLLALGARR